MKLIEHNIYQPETEQEFLNYFTLRWEILRQPWQQAAGSEQDDLETQALHRMLVVNGDILAIGRLHFAGSKTAQIRYMGVRAGYEGKGYGTNILNSLEHAASENNISLINLQARETAVGFYKKMGYEIKKKSHILFDSIQHYEMHKQL